MWSCEIEMTVQYINVNKVSIKDCKVLLNNHTLHIVRNLFEAISCTTKLIHKKVSRLWVAPLALNSVMNHNFKRTVCLYQGARPLFNLLPTCLDT